MKNTTFTYEEAVKKIDSIGGKPIVVEAQWDGDTQGWFLRMFVIVRTGIFKKTESSHYLGTISLGGDIGLFQGTIPPYSEVKVAQEIGGKLKDKYGLEFFFPSPNNPDDDCPRWTERHRAINCENCNKLIIPTDSPYLPKEICYNCHLIRKQNQRIIDEEPYDDGVDMYLNKNGEFQSLGFCSNFESFKIAPFIKEKVEGVSNEEGIKIVTLPQDDIKKLIQDLEIEIDKQILEYEEPKIEKRMSRFVTTQKMKYKEKEFELMNRFNSHHENLIGLISSFDTAKRAFSESFEYKIYFKKGISHRDDSVLRFVNYSGKGKMKIDQIYERFNGIISTEEVDKTISKLVKIGCMKLNDNEAEVTEIGKNIV
ncbi:hypothetical protein FUA23_21765 [Neolewinella aurantiaca]|uniref:Uncharacterized protein n=1 Tax=Neolewinella aurantiaca TaxID=2602767 RepID=A0A5C7FGP3_9BACT|nr:hypothetical protein [Neolewinella aurantiaca]TXF82570.1 hypothetical protein FUA23_21765 [Neolewinella aurantiaca]